MYVRMWIKYCATVICAMCGGTSLFAQILSVYNVNASGFPLMKANYAAYDYSNKPLVGLLPSDFRVIETAQNGAPVNLSPTVTVDCVTQLESDASVIIVVDRSGSMDSLVNGRTRWSYTRDAVNSLVAKIGFKGNTRVSVLSFASNLELWNEWVDSPTPIADTIRKKFPGGGTNYELCFSEPGINIYDLFAKRPPNIPRYVVFLTDGYPNPDIENPTRFMDTNSARMRSMGIKFYGITILERSAHPTILGLSKLTGGKSIVTNEEELANIFTNLAVENSTLTECIITWRSPFTCEEQARNRSAEITILNPFRYVANVSYKTPGSSVATPSISPMELDCGDPDINSTSTAELTITAGLTGVTLSNPRVTPSGFFKILNWNTQTNQTTFSPIVLAPNEVRKILVEFTQGADLRTRRAMLQFDGIPCPLQCPLVGGLGKIKVVSPNGGETYSTCDSITIVWTGIAPSLPADIFYTTPGLPDPILIASGVKGLRYKWQAPQPGTQYKIKVTSTVPSDYQWIKQLGAYGADSVSSISTNALGSVTMLTGWIDGPSTLGTKELKSSYGNTDGFVAFLDSVGSVTKANFLSGIINTTNEKVVGGVFDNKYNAFVVGTSNGKFATFGAYGGIAAGPEDTQNMSVQMIDANGFLRWYTQTRGATGSASWVSPTRIGWRAGPRGTVEIVVEGLFSSYATFGTDPYGSPTFLTTVNSKVDPFTVVYNENGNVLSLTKFPASGQITWQSTKTNDKVGYEYSASTITTDTVLKPLPTKYSPLGVSDILVTKYGAPLPVFDFSDTWFSVVAPSYTLRATELIFAENNVGNPVTQTRNSAICNTSSVALKVVSIKVVGTHASDFSITTPIAGISVAPKTCLDIPVTFTPTEVGIRIAILEVVMSCGISFTIPLRGTSVNPCPVEIKQTVFLPTAESVVAQEVTITCVLKNTGKVNLVGILNSTADVGIRLNNPGAFTLAPDECLDAQITIDPIAFGSRSLVLSYGLSGVCSQEKTTITAIVVPPYVVIDSVDVGKHRLGTNANGVVTVRNLSNVQRTIERFEIPPSNSSDITFILNQTPIVIPARAAIEIPVQFTPTTRGAHLAIIYAFIDSIPEPLVGRAIGEGILPEISARGYNFASTLVGTTSLERGYVTISNTDDSTELYIQNVIFATPTLDFSWRADVQTFPQIIAPGQEIQVPVEFFASASGARSVNVVIEHDAEFGSVPPYATTVVQVTGSGFDAKILDVNLGEILTCDKATATFTIENPSMDLPLRIDQIVAGSGSSSKFSINEDVPITLSPSQIQTITLEFSYNVEGTYRDTFYVYSGNVLIQTVNVTATTYTQPLQVIVGGNASTNIDADYTLPVQVSTAPLQANIPLSTVRFLVTFDNQVLGYRGINGYLPNWSISGALVQSNQLEVTATPQPGAAIPFVPTSVFEVVFHTFLTAKPAVGFAVTASSELECLTEGTALQSVILNLGCAAQSRIVTFGPSAFSLQQPTPNPSAAISTIRYSTGITTSTTFEVLNSVGAVVMNFTTQEMPSGEYDLLLQTDQLSNGLYTLQMLSGPFVSTQRLAVFR